MIDVGALLEHLRWADDRVLDGLGSVESPPAEAVELYAHVVAAELVWLDRIEGVEQSVPVWPEVDLGGCRRLAEATARRWAGFLGELDAAGLCRVIAYENSAGRSFSSRVDEILCHLALHGAYHRGQIASALRRAGARPAPTDFIAWARGGATATREDDDPTIGGGG